MKHLIFAAVLVFSAAAPVFSGSGSFGDYLLIDSYPEARLTGKSVSAGRHGFVFSGENPAALAGVEGSGVSAMYGSWKMGVNINKAGAARAFDFGVFGAEITNYDLGSLSLLDMDSYGDPVITGEVEELYALMFKGMYAADFESFSFGLALKTVSEAFDGDFMHIGVDAGGIIKKVFVRELSIGLSFLNVSAKTDGYALPLTVNGALVYEYKDEGRSVFTAGAGAGYLVYDGIVEFSAGFSYSPASFFHIGGGVVFDEEMNAAVSAGGGVNYGAVSMDYIFMPDAVLGDTHKISVYTAFNTKEKETGEKRPAGEKFEKYMKTGDFHYKNKKYSKAIKYYEYINVLSWRELEKLPDIEKSGFFQKMGISYYNIRENKRAKEYFERALYYDSDNEILKHWIDLLK